MAGLARSLTRLESIFRLVDQPRSVASRLGVFLLPVAATALLLIVVAPIVVFRDLLPDFTALGYLGAFLVSLIGAGGIVIPMPSLAVVFALGGTEGFVPLLLGLVAGGAETLGELTGYGIGRSAESAFGNGRIHRLLTPIMRRWGFPALFLFSAIPNPLFDIVGVAAGASGTAVRGFLVPVFFGKFIKMTAVAYAGAWGLETIVGLLP